MKKGLKTLILGIVLFILGAVVVPVVLVFSFILNDSDDHQFIIPGTTEVEVVEPGRYYLWNNYKTIFEGKTYNRSEEIPDGLQISILNSSGEELSFVSSLSMTSSTANNSKSSIGYVDVLEPSVLSVSVLGQSEARVFSFSQSDFVKFMLVALGVIGIAVISGLAGIAISIWGVVKMVKNNKQVAQG